MAETIRFATADDVTLEGELREPDAPPIGSAVMCHPHPSHGGSKDHPLLWAIRNALAHAGFTVLAFNFRGVMGSGGTYGGGVTETADLEAAVDRVRAAAGEAPTVAVGWSFGANVALRVAVDDDRIRALALVGLPLAESRIALPAIPEREDLRRLERPVLLVSGAADPFSPVPDLRTLARRLPRAEVLIVPDTDHFFWKREAEVAERIAGFMTDAVGEPSGT